MKIELPLAFLNAMPINWQSRFSALLQEAQTEAQRLGVAIPQYQVHVNGHVVSDPALPMRKIIFNLIQASGDAGMATWEVEQTLQKDHASVSARVHDLVKENLLYDKGERRLTKNGKSAIVYVSAKKGI